MRLSSPTFRRLGRLAAVVLLTWTGVDLIATQLCAADSVVMVTSRAGAAALQAEGSGDSDPVGGASRTHVDDCFCCSHCVNVVLAEPVLDVTGDTRRALAARVGVPFDDGHPLYHPPQLS